MQLRDIVPNLSGVRRGGYGYVARCPAHDDKRPSLSLWEGQGRIMLRCFAGCQTKDVIAKLGLSWKDLFNARMSYPQGRSYSELEGPRDTGLKGLKGGRGMVLCVYPYVDEEGRLLYESCRLQPKDFRQRRYDVRGEPVWNLEGVRRVPYRLPEIITARDKGQDIFLCEGEKDADSLRELGFTASNFKQWRPEFNQFVQGVHVIVMADHDKPGLKMAAEAARIILKAAASVKIVDVWEQKELTDSGGLDVSDYVRVCVEAEGLDADAIKERICEMAERTQNWRDPEGAKAEDYFLVRSGNAWINEAKSKPSPKRLFGKFWFENELCILFADTNVGKSILAVQIADAISRGGKSNAFRRESGGGEGASVEPSSAVAEGFTPEGVTLTNDVTLTEVPAQKVVYFDFELTAKQFESRFSEAVEGSETYLNHYEFHPNFYRAEINPETSDLGGYAKFEDFLNNALETTVVSSGSKVLVIDNLTYLRDETENARNALPLMKYLKALKAKYGLSILALAHTPKRDSTKPLGRNDLQGSKMIINFCDSSFAIGESAKQPGLRYLKQIKARNTEIVYHTENVLMATVEKESNFLHFKFHDTAFEAEHLKVINDKQREALKQQARDLAAAGMSSGKIAQRLGISKMTAHRYSKSEQTVSDTGVTD